MTHEWAAGLMEEEHGIEAGAVQALGGLTMEHSIGDMPEPKVDEPYRNRNVNPVYVKQYGPLGPGACTTNIRNL